MCRSVAVRRLLCYYVCPRTEYMGSHRQYPPYMGVVALMRCPYCHHERTRVIDTSHDARGGVRRRRLCNNCERRFTTYERAILATPLLEKRDGTREEFSREKLEAGIRLACTKRPISAEQIERIVGEVEAELQQITKAEIPSRLVGDKVIKKLREIDEVAYIRYAIVYLGLDDLGAVKAEINRLFEES